MEKRQPKNRQQKIATGKFDNEKMTGVGKKGNVKLVFRRESNSLFRLQKQWHGLRASYVTTLVLKSYAIHRLQWPIVKIPSRCPKASSGSKNSTVKNKYCKKIWAHVATVWLSARTTVSRDNQRTIDVGKCMHTARRAVFRRLTPHPRWRRTCVAIDRFS